MREGGTHGRRLGGADGGEELTGVVVGAALGGGGAVRSHRRRGGAVRSHRRRGGAVRSHRRRGGTVRSHRRRGGAVMSHRRRGGAVRSHRRRGGADRCHVITTGSEGQSGPGGGGYDRITCNSANFDSAVLFSLTSH